MITIKKEFFLEENNYLKLQTLLKYWEKTLPYKFTYSEIINYIINKEYWELMQLEEFREINKGEENNGK